MPVSSSANTAQLIKDFLAAIERSDFNVVLRIIRAAPQLLDRVFDPNVSKRKLLILPFFPSLKSPLSPL